MRKRLKPCPFCGGNAELVFSGRCDRDGYKRGFIIVKCQICGGAGKGAFYAGYDVLDDIGLENTIGGEKAMTAWNMRA